MYYFRGWHWRWNVGQKLPNSTYLEWSPQSSSSVYWKLVFITVRNSSCERLCFHRCLSVHRGEVYTPLGRPPHGRPPLAMQTPPRQTATAADGTHPTGMHSCLNRNFTCQWNANIRWNGLYEETCCKFILFVFRVRGLTIKIVKLFLS